MEPACPIPDNTSLKRRTPWNTLSARVISVVSRKGGVGKTTSAVNIGAAFALSGHTVLVIGTDPQCGVARTLGYSPDDLGGGLLDLWDNDTALTGLAQTSPLKDLFFVSSRLRDINDEDRFERAMAEQPDVFVQQIDRARNLYDTIIIDCPPHLGAPTRASIAASDGVLVPAQAEELCRDSLGALLGALDTFKEATGNEALDGPELEGIFLTMLNERTRMGRHVAASMTEEFGPVLFSTAVPRTTRLSEMALRGKPTVIYDRRSPGSRAYFNLADEIMSRYQMREGMVAFGADTGIDTDIDTDADTEVETVANVESPDSEQPNPDKAYSTDPDRGMPGGLERLIGDLQASGNLELPSAPQPSEFGNPDLVSLEDLLAEEESKDRDSWGSTWHHGDSGDDRMN